MKTNYVLRYSSNPQDVKTYDTERLRDEFMIKLVLAPNEVNMYYSIEDRMIIGGAMPIDEELALGTINLLRTPYFMQQREIGIINVGGKGSVRIDQQLYELDHKDALYVGCGTKTVVFISEDKAHPAKFYFNSTPAFTNYPDKKVTIAELVASMPGREDKCNKCSVFNMIGTEAVRSCQLQMGITIMDKNNVWNTEPVDDRYHKLETFFVFDLPEGEAVCQFLGEPSETRHLWLQGMQGIIIPEWSIHPSVATHDFSVVWGRSGAVLDYVPVENGDEQGLR